MKPFIEQAQCYAQYHRKPVTLYTHLIGIPCLLFSLMIFFGFFHLVIPGVMDLNLASLGTVLLLLYYYVLNWRLALVLTVLFFCFLWIADWIGSEGPTSYALWTFLIAFLLGWILQLIGHCIEGRRPAFFDHFGQIFIAPLFLTAEVFFKTGRLNKLKEQIHGSSDLKIQ